MVDVMGDEILAANHSFHCNPALNPKFCKRPVWNEQIVSPAYIRKNKELDNSLGFSLGRRVSSLLGIYGHVEIRKTG